MNKIKNISLDGIKIVDFLAERFKLSKGWQEKYKGILIKIENFTNLLKNEKINDEINNFIEENNFKLNYINIKKLKNLLWKSDESKKKNILGFNNSKFIVECENILKLFNKNNFNLVNLGKEIERLVKYDLKSLKSNIINYKNQEKNLSKSIENKISNNNFIQKEVIAYLKNNFNYETDEDIYQININEVFNKFIKNILNKIKQIDEKIDGFNNKFDFKKLIEIYEKNAKKLKSEGSNFHITKNYLSNVLNKLNEEDYIKILKSKNLIDSIETSRINNNEQSFEGFIVVEESNKNDENINGIDIILNKEKRSKLIIELNELKNFFVMSYNLSVNKNEYQELLEKKNNDKLNDLNLIEIKNELMNIISLLTNNDFSKLLIFNDILK